MQRRLRWKYLMLDLQLDSRESSQRMAIIVMQKDEQRVTCAVTTNREPGAVPRLNGSLMRGLSIHSRMASGTLSRLAISREN